MKSIISDFTVCHKSAIIFENLQERVQTIGPDVELFTDETTLSRPLSELQQMITRAGARPLVLHTPNWFTYQDQIVQLGIGHYDEQREQAAVAVILRCIDLSRGLLHTAHKKLVIHPTAHIYNSSYRHNRLDKDQLLLRSQHNLHNSLQRLLPYAQQHEITLCLENMPPIVNRPEQTDALAHYWFVFPHEFNLLLNHYHSPYLTTCFDTCHYEMTLRMTRLFSRFNRGIGLYNPDELENIPASWHEYAASLQQVGVIHLSAVNDIGLNPSTHGQPLSAATLVPAVQLLKTLQQKTPRPVITLEVYEQPLSACLNAQATFELLTQYPADA